MSKYDDIINLPHHISKTRPQMSLYNRSAQFAPFAALTGYEDRVKETARLTDEKINIDEGLRNILNNKLNIIEEHIRDIPEISITYFIKDKYKDGGKYETKLCSIKKIDQVNEVVILTDKSKIEMNNIVNITGEIIDKYFE